MPFFLIEISYSSAEDRAANPNFEVRAATSGKAINLVLANQNAVAEERLIHSIHCGAPQEDSISDEEWKEIEPDLAPLIRLPDGPMPPHVVRG